MEGVQCVGDYMIRYKIREPPKKTENIVFLGSNLVKKIPLFGQKNTPFEP